MENTIEQLEAHLLALPLADRLRLTEALLASFEPDPEIEQAWLDEINRRYKAYLAGEVEAIPIERALADARAALAR